MDFLELFNPLKHFSQGEYLSFWHYLFLTLLSGFWARLIASLSILFSFWFGVYRRRPALGALFFIVAVFISYFGGLMKAFFWWWG
jgi:hypothetical protein